MATITLGQGDQTHVYLRGGAPADDTIADFQSIYLSAELNGDNEIGGVPTEATATGVFVLNRAQTALSVDVIIDGLDLSGTQTVPTDDNVLGFHFHRAPATANGAVIWGAIGPDNDTDNDTVIDGPNNRLTSAWDGTEGNAGATLASQLPFLLTEGVYLNIHSQEHTGGEIRGQLIKEDDGADLIDVSLVNIGEFATLLQVMSDVGGAATIDTRFGGVSYVLRIAGAAVADLDADDFVFAGSLAESFEGTAGADDLFGAGGNDTMIGGSGSDRLFGEDGNDVMTGGFGDDTTIGGLGDDFHIVNSAGDVVTEAAGEGTDTLQTVFSTVLAGTLENLVLAGSANLNGTGNASNNRLTGNAGNNTLIGLQGDDLLNGGAGTDMMTGGTGNDVYVVDSASDSTSEAGGDGIDTVQSSVARALGAGLERLTLTGSADVNGFGNVAANILFGNGGNNLLDGGGGVDFMQGGLGNDTYVVDNAGDVTSEQGGGGSDLVQSSVGRALGAGLERLTLTGSSNINGFGNAAANVLIGNAGNNQLDGAAGNDTMLGGLGNDTYVVDSASDVTSEQGGGGTDLVISSVSKSLGAGLENLTLTGAATLGLGNDLVNRIIGNAQNNILDGGAGADFMSGGAGNDHYTVDSGSDVASEVGGSGDDTISTSANYAMGAGIETMVLLGSAVLGLGSAGDNEILGNDAGNVLDGKAGMDTIEGRGGADRIDFTTALNAATNVDRLQFFDAAVDRIGLDDAVFTQLGGAVTADSFVVAAQAQDAADRIVYDQPSGGLFYDADGTGATEAIQFAIVSLGPDLDHTNFLVI